MCYLIAKRCDDIGCLALQTSHGQQLVELKKIVGWNRRR
jgi:hypothetical protein